MPMARGLRGSVTGRHVIRVSVETLGSTSLQGGRAWESIAPRVTGVGHTSHDRVSGHATRSPESHSLGRISVMEGLAVIARI